MLLSFTKKMILLGKFFDPLVGAFVICKSLGCREGLPTSQV